MSKKFKMSIQYDEELSFHEECRQLSTYVYHKGDTSLPQGYKVLGYAYNPDDGFYAEVVCKGNNVVIVSRGTEFEQLNDDRNDLAMLRGRTPAQYYSLMELYNKEIIPMKEREPNIKVTFTGHSLSGTTSNLAAVTTGEDAVCFAPFAAEGLLPQGVQRKNAKIINYGHEDDLVFTSYLNRQMGEVRVVDRANDALSHTMESWGALREYVPYEQSESFGNIFSDRQDIREKRYFLKRIKNNVPTGQAANIDSHSESECPGSYPVSGYTRSDGTKVSGYTRNCYKHSGKIPKLTDLSAEEIDWWVAKLI